MRSRHGLGVLALCGLVFGLMALSATGAQAAMKGCTAANTTEKPCWMINGANITSATKIKAIGKPDPNSPVLLTKSGANAVAISCSTIEAEATVEPEGLARGTVNFSNCTTKVNGVSQPVCDPINQPIKAGGAIEIVLHEGTAYARATGEGAEGIFATIKFKDECLLLAAPIKITGIGWIKDCKGEFEKEGTPKLIEEGKVPAKPESEGGLGGLKFGSNPATIDESITIELTDAEHKGQKFSGLAD